MFRNLVSHMLLFIFQNGNGSSEQEGRAGGSQRSHTAVECQSFRPVRTVGTERSEYRELIANARFVTRSMVKFQI